MDWSAPFVQGFTLCMSIILAIGPQNTYVMRQGALGRHVLTTIIVCSLCDIVLICLGAFGLAYGISCVPWLRQALIWGGVIFISAYAFKSFRRAIMGGYYQDLQAGGPDVASRGRVILMAMGFSVLNPHAILDTVIMIGGMALRFDEFDDRAEFAAGASLASIVWFILLGTCARMLSKVLRTPIGVRVFDGIVGLIMLWILFNLFEEAWPGCFGPPGVKV